MNKKDFIAGIVFIIISVVMFLDTYTFPITPVQGAGPAFWPRLLSILLVILSVILIINSFKSQEKNVDKPKKANYKPYLGILLSVLYFLLFRKVGFVVMTFFYFCGLSILADDSETGFPNKKGLLLMVFQSAVLLGIVYFVFRVFLRVNLPQGMFF